LNGEGFIVAGRAHPLAHYPHLRRVGSLVFVSGLSARQPDGTIPGANGDIGVQTEAVLENLKVLLSHVGLDLEAVVDLTVFLTDMATYNDFNAVYNRYFSADSGPTRTTVGVQSLPGPTLLIEMKAVAWSPNPTRAGRS
jgi:2-aminomuconate deaminase